MYYRLKERAIRLLGDIEQLLYVTKDCNVKIEKKDGKIEFPCDFSKIEGPFESFSNGDYYANDYFDKYVLFKLEVDFPSVQDGEDLFLNICTNQSGHNMLKPQMLLFKDGAAVQGLDTNHRYVKLNELQGKKQSFYLYAFSGIQADHGYKWCALDTEKGVKLFVSVVSKNRLLYKYYINVKTALSQTDFMDENSADCVKILYALNESLALLDLRYPHSDDFYKSLEKANEHVEKELYSTIYENTGEATLIGHTHLDVAWLWQYSHTRDKVLRSFATEIKLLQEYDEHRFMSSQAQLYDFVKAQQPELYNKIKDYVDLGRWEIEGAMWVEPDMNLASGESIVRQILYGKRFFKDEFGKDCKVLWLPDVFGYSAALPQILKKSGVDYFMTAKLHNNDRNRFPYDTFYWKGIDGSQVLSHLVTYLDSVYCPDIERGEILKGYRNYAQKDINDDILVPFGYADGGGGPNAEQIETVIRLKNGLPGVPKTKYGKVGEYFERLQEKVQNSERTPCWNGELYFENHRGTLTSIGRIKKQNRRAENLYQNTEWLWTLADRFEKAQFPKAEFDEMMKKVLINQFHDVLPGSSIKPVYDDSDKLYNEIDETADGIIDNAMGRILYREKDAVTVFNPYSESVSGYVKFEDNRYFVENVSAKGAVTFAKLHNKTETPVTVNGNVIENKYYVITLGKDGFIESLFDKINNRECFIKNKSGNRLRVFEDRCAYAPESNWNLDNYYKMHEYEMPDPDSIEVLENNGEYAVIRISRFYQNSRITQDMVVYASSPRIDFETEIDWKEVLQVLKAEFPVDVNTNKAKYEIQFGFVERPTTKNTSWDNAAFEVCGHKWADVSDGGYGMALINDCKYGHSAEDSTISLTLLRSGDSPHLTADRELHNFTYSIIPHNSDYTVTEITKQASILNNPLFAVKGALKTGESYSLFNVFGAVLDTVKPAENGNGYILRLYEPTNSTTAVKITSDAKILSADFTDLLENNLDEKAEINSNAINFRIKPFEIVTLRVNLE